MRVLFFTAAALAALVANHAAAILLPESTTLHYKDLSQLESSKEALNAGVVFNKLEQHPKLEQSSSSMLKVAPESAIKAPVTKSHLTSAGNAELNDQKNPKQPNAERMPAHLVTMKEIQENMETDKIKEDAARKTNLKAAKAEADAADGPTEASVKSYGLKIAQLKKELTDSTFMLNKIKTAVSKSQKPAEVAAQATMQGQNDRKVSEIKQMEEMHSKMQDMLKKKQEGDKKKVEAEVEEKEKAAKEFKANAEKKLKDEKDKAEKTKASEEAANEKAEAESNKREAEKAKEELAKVKKDAAKEKAEADAAKEASEKKKAKADGKSEKGANDNADKEKVEKEKAEKEKKTADAAAKAKQAAVAAAPAAPAGAAPVAPAGAAPAGTAPVAPAAAPPAK